MEATPGVGIDAVVESREMARTWSGGWRRYLFPAFWLFYLGQTVAGISHHSHGAVAVVGYLLVAAFAVAYLVALPLGWAPTGPRPTRFYVLYGGCFALTAALAPFAQAEALVCVVYLAVMTVACRARWSVPVVAVLAALAGVLPAVVPGWGGALDWSTALTVALVGFAMFGFFQIIGANVALSAARTEVARLAAENERSRIARDLHDLLGHSLTTITVKAGLARRLAERGDAARALVEITEVESLTRATLGDVRAAVAGHREMTLAGELATSREVLRAAGIVGELPAAVDVADPAVSELFGWVLREAITNVVRHSRADHVRVVLGPRSLEISDDGRGGSPSAGSGLRGLEERVVQAGGELTVGGTATGFRLRVEVPRHGDTHPPATRVEARGVDAVPVVGAG